MLDIIEYATIKMPLEVVFVDSGFHLLTGAYTGAILAYFYKKFYLKLNRGIRDILAKGLYYLNGYTF